MKFEILKKKSLLGESLLFLGSQILVFSGFILFFTTTMFFLGKSINIFIFPISFLFSLITTTIIFKGFFRRISSIEKVCILFLGLVFYFISFFLGKYFYDLSWDGQEYHQEIIIQLVKNKWNPIMENLPNSVDIYMEPWVKHYPKGSEILASSIYVISKSIESGKMFNILFALSSFLFVLGGILKHSKINIPTALLVSFVASFPPVVIYQSFSYYLDGQMASLSLIFLVLGFLILKERGEKYLFVWISVMIVIISLKFTGIAFAGIACLSLLILCVIAKNLKLAKKIFLMESIGGLIAIGFIGFSPYVTNVLEEGNPFYPLAGVNARDITSGLTPENIRDLSIIEKFIVSHFTLSNLDNKIYPRIPFLPNPNLGQFPRTYGDARVDGEGLFFMEISFVSFLIFLKIIISKPNKKNVVFLMVVLLSLLLGVFVIPDNWWARYVPFLYLIPFVILIFYFLNYKKYFFFAHLLLFVMVLNSGIEIIKYIKPQLYSTYEINNILSDLDNRNNKTCVYTPTGFFLNNTERLEENNIDYVIINDLNEWESIEFEEYSFPNSNLLLKVCNNN